jgi:hypothetical protein
VAVSGGTLTVEGTGLEPVVFTSIHDDAIVGDTQKDGSAVRPSPGDWNCLLLNNFGMRSRIEHLHARYGGSSSASLQLYDPLATTRSLRADFSATDGIRAANHSGDAVNWIAAHNAGDGIDVSGGNFDLRLLRVGRLDERRRRGVRRDQRQHPRGPDVRRRRERRLLARVRLALHRCSGLRRRARRDQGPS